jgi:hypothetical protein
MKSSILLLIALTLVGCSSTHNKSRGIASVSGCSLEMHKNGKLFRVLKHNEPYNDYWYHKDDAESLMDRLDKKNSCN